MLCVPCVVGVIVFAQVPAFAQAPGTLPAGQYHNNSLLAYFFAFSASGNLNLSVTDTTNVAVPKVGPPTSTRVTSIFVEVFGGAFFASGCYDIAPSDFTFSSAAAAVHTTITDTTATCGGPPGSFPTPFTIDATWTGTGPITATRNLVQLDCGGYGAETIDNITSSAASAAVTLAPVLSDQFTAQNQLLRSDDQRIHANGVSPDSCQPAPGIPGGPGGLPPAGENRSTSAFATASFFNGTGPSLGIFVTNTMQVSSPKGGPSTVTSEFDVNVNVRAGGNFGGGCYELTPADFSANGVLGATLSMTITSATPTCPGVGPGSWPLPQTIHVVWTGTAAVVSLRSVGQLVCASYRSEGQGLSLSNANNVTATLTPFLTTDLTSTDGLLFSTTSHAHVEGQQSGCPV